MLKAYKYRIYPNELQKRLIEQTFSACRVVYNVALETKIRAYKEHKVSLSFYDLQSQMVEMKQDYLWLRQVNSQSLQATLQNMDGAFKKFFKGAGYPKFKSKRGSQSFQCPANTRKIDFEKGLLTIPKIPNIRLTVSRKFEGKIKTVSISRTASGKYFASILVQIDTVLPVKTLVESAKTIGIDLGLKDFAIASDGRKWSNPKFLRNDLQRLKVLQQRASRKKKGSNNRKKANKKVAVQHEKIVNKRKDYLQKLSTELVNDSQVASICVESLAVKNMVKNHKLAQAISDASWSEFVRMLEYKCEWSGKNLIKIGRFEPSTKTCNSCGALNETLTLADRIWTCASCYVTHDRDVNASKNIKIMGLQHSRRGTPEEPAELPTKIIGVLKQE